MFELFNPPKFFADVKFHRHTQRSIGWLELFYDLVYVATLIQIGNFLSDNVSLLGFGQFLVMLTVVWWAWIGETFYQNRYVTDDIIHRIMVFTQMFAVATLGLSISGAFGELYIQFTLAYVTIRLLLVVMFIRASLSHPESRELTRSYAFGFSFGIAIWLGSLLLPAEYHWVGWLVGISVELLVPQLPNIRKLRQTWGIDLHHISERVGIFTIIVLGESFVKILDDSQGIVLGINEFAFSAIGLTVLYCLWWLYFSDTADELIDIKNNWKSTLWLYGHLPLSIGLVAFGVGAKKAFAAVVSYPNEAINPDYRLLYTAAIVLYLLALAMIDIGLDDKQTSTRQRTEAITHLIGAILIVIWGIAFTEVTPILFITPIMIILLVQVIISIYQTRQATQASAIVS